MRNRIVFLLFLAVSCKHEPVIDQPQGLTIQPSATIVYIGDSLLLTTNATTPLTWNISPEAGAITAGGYYKAPTTVLHDSLKIILTATAGSEQVAALVTVIRRGANDTAISFSKTILPLMEANCNFKGCHGNGSKAGKVELNNYANTLKTVYPYQPQKSLLFLSLIKTDPLRRMPPAGDLHPYRIDYFRKWIEQGAGE